MALGHDTYPVNTAPLAYDIVRVAFPYVETPHEPGPKLRPGLVLAVRAFETKDGEEYASVQIAYGTSRSQQGSDPWDVMRVHNYVALQRSGLSRDTWFRLDRIQTILWSREYFPFGDDDDLESPVLGHLPQDHILQLKQIKETRDELRKRGLL